MEFKLFEESVKDLADTLPQWHTDDVERKTQSAISSLFEEAGEISGLISKYRIRKNYYKAVPKDLENFSQIREKFIDEVGDFLWVLVCSIQCIVKEDTFNLEEMLNNEEVYAVDLNTALFDVIADISALRQCLLFESDTTSDAVDVAFEDIIVSFRTFLFYLNLEYDITLDDLCEYNMNKLGKRYGDNKGAK